MTPELQRAIRLRDRAEELRMIAERSNAATRRKLLQVADECDRVAAALEDLANLPAVGQEGSVPLFRRQAG